MVIAERRNELNLTQFDVAKLLGVDRSTVAKWETSQSLPRAELLPKLAEILNCTTDELLGIVKKSCAGSEKVEYDS